MSGFPCPRAFFFLWSCFSRIGSLAYSYILDNRKLCGKSSGEDLLLFQHASVPVDKTSSTKKHFTGFEEEELDWPAQRCDIEPIQHLWHQLKHDYDPSLITQHLCQTSMLLWLNGSLLLQPGSRSYGDLSEEWRFILQYIHTHCLEMRCSTVVHSNFTILQLLLFIYLCCSSSL